MKKRLKTIAFIVLFMMVFCGVTPVNLAKNTNNSNNHQTMQIKPDLEVKSAEKKNTIKSKMDLFVVGKYKEELTAQIEIGQLSTENEEKCIIKSKQTQSNVASGGQESIAEPREEQIITESPTEVESENITEAESEKEESTETESENITETESEKEEFTETESENITETESEKEESTETESEKVTETETEKEEFTETDPEEPERFIDEIMVLGDCNWNDSKNYYYTKQNYLEIEVCIIKQFNTAKEMTVQIGKNDLYLSNDKKNTYIGEITLLEGCNKIEVSFMLEGREKDRSEFTIIKDSVLPVITKVDNKEIDSGKIYQNRIIKAGETIVFEINEEEYQASGIRGVRILDANEKEIGYYININVNKITCTFTEPLANMILQVVAIDNAGNISDKLMIFLDTEPPDIQITPFIVEDVHRRLLYKETTENNICRIYTNKEHISAELEVQDKISGIVTVEAVIDGVIIEPVIMSDNREEIISYQFDFEVRKSDTITYLITDFAGNCTEAVYEVFLDKIAPTWRIEKNEIETIQNRTFQIPVCEKESGIWKAYIEREGKKFLLTQGEEGYGYTFSEEEIDKSTEKVEYTLYLMDKAGNTFTDYFSLLFDFTAPQIELSVYKSQEDGGNPFSCELSGTIEQYYTNTDCRVVIAVTDKTNGGCLSEEIALTLLTKENNGTHYSKNLELVDGVCEFVVMFSKKEYIHNRYILRACDAVGNYSEYTFEIIYDSAKPVISIIELEGGLDKIYQNRRQFRLLIEEPYFSKSDLVFLPIGSQKEEVPKVIGWSTEGIKHSATLTFSNDGVYCFEIVCTDKAGNKSIYKMDKLVIDTIAPDVTISYEKEGQEQGIYYNQLATITVIDKNFDITQNPELIVMPKGKSSVISKWKRAKNADEYTCTVQFAEDGIYQFQCAYKDKAGNMSSIVTSDILVIDHTVPFIQASYIDKKSKTGMNLNPSGMLRLEITEENFSGEFVEVLLYNQKNAKKTNLKVSWKKAQKHTYKATYWIQEDGIYRFTVRCKDKADNEAEVYQSEIFLVDRNKPIVDIYYEGIKRTDDCYNGSRTARITVRDVSFNENCTTNFNITPKNIPVTISTWTKKSIEHTNEYEYSCTVTFEQDGAYRFQFSCMDQAGNLSDIVQGDRFIIDNTAPVIQIEFAHTEIKDGKTYHRTKTAVVKITEQNFVKENVFIEPIGLAATHVLPTVGEWSSDGTIHSATIDFAEDGLYGFRIQCRDKAGNEGKMELENGGFFIIDSTAPSVKIVYNKDTLKNNTYYNMPRTAKVIVTDVNFDEHCEVNFDFGAENIRPKIGKWRQEGTDYICEVFFEKDGEYHFEFFCKDKAGNLSNTIDGGSFVIDLIEPQISVSFDNNNVKNEKYYNDSRTATITIVERAFSEQLVQIKALDIAKIDRVPVISQWKTDGEQHTATINFTEEGVYGFQIVCRDLAGNSAKNYISTVFVIDKTAPQITFEGVRANSANRGVVMPVVNYTDSFLDESATTVTLTGTNHSDQTANAQRSVIADGIRLSYPDFAHIKEMDDVYTLKIKAVDLAGNEKEEEISFSVNRFGSTYKISVDTQQLIDNYYTAKAPVITVTEVNIDALEYGEVTVSRDGQIRTLVRGKDYNITKEGVDTDWKSYTYKIKTDNFSSDGIYSIGFYSVDKARNASDNRIKGKEIEFVLDTTAPSIVVDGIESGGIYTERQKKVTLDVKDNLCLADLQVTDNGETILSMSGKTLSEKNGIVTFLLQEKDAEREIVITARDKAKNEQKQMFDGVLISSRKEVIHKNAVKKTKNIRKGMAEKNIEVDTAMESATEYTDGLTMPIYEKENYLLYSVSTVMIVAVLMTAGIVQVRKRRQKKQKKSGGSNA